MRSIVLYLMAFEHDQSMNKFITIYTGRRRSLGGGAVEFVQEEKVDYEGEGEERVYGIFI